MRTARLLPVSPSMHCSGGGGWGVPAQEVGVSARGVPARRGVPAWGGVPAWECTCPRGVPAQGGLCLPRGAVPAWGGVPAWGCVYLLGVYLPRGCTYWGCTCPGTPPVNRMTDRCKNITLPQTSFVGGEYEFFVTKIQVIPGMCSIQWILAVKHFHCNAMRKSIKAHENWHEIKQIEYIPSEKKWVKFFP